MWNNANFHKTALACTLQGSAVTQLRWAEIDYYVTHIICYYFIYMGALIISDCEDGKIYQNRSTGNKDIVKIKWLRKNNFSGSRNLWSHVRPTSLNTPVLSPVLLRLYPLVDFVLYTSDQFFALNATQLGTKRVGSLFNRKYCKMVIFLNRTKTWTHEQSSVRTDSKQLPAAEEHALHSSYAVKGVLASSPCRAPTSCH